LSAAPEGANQPVDGFSFRQPEPFQTNAGHGRVALGGRLAPEEVTKPYPKGFCHAVVRIQTAFPVAGLEIGKESGGYAGTLGHLLLGKTFPGPAVPKVFPQPDVYFIHIPPPSP